MNTQLQAILAKLRILFKLFEPFIALGKSLFKDTPSLKDEFQQILEAEVEEEVKPAPKPRKKRTKKL